MARSTFQEADVAADEDVLTGYLLTDNDPEPSTFPHDPLIYTAGGLLSSISELTNYLRMQLNNGEYNGNQILSEESLNQMREGYVKWDYALLGLGQQVRVRMDDKRIHGGGSIQPY